MGQEEEQGCVVENGEHRHRSVGQHRSRLASVGEGQHRSEGVGRAMKEAQLESDPAVEAAAVTNVDFIKSCYRSQDADGWNTWRCPGYGNIICHGDDCGGCVCVRRSRGVR